MGTAHCNSTQGENLIVSVDLCLESQYKNTCLFDLCNISILRKNLPELTVESFR